MVEGLRCFNPVTGKRDGGYCVWEGDGKCLKCRAADEIDRLRDELEKTKHALECSLGREDVYKDRYMKGLVELEREHLVANLADAYVSAVELDLDESERSQRYSRLLIALEERETTKGERQMTEAEQEVMHRALRKSVETE